MKKFVRIDATRFPEESRDEIERFNDWADDAHKLLEKLTARPAAGESYQDVHADDGS